MQMLLLNFPSRILLSGSRLGVGASMHFYDESSEKEIGLTKGALDWIQSGGETMESYSPQKESPTLEILGVANRCVTCHRA